MTTFHFTCVLDENLIQDQNNIKFALITVKKDNATKQLI